MTRGRLMDRDVRKCVCVGGVKKLKAWNLEPRHHLSEHCVRVPGSEEGTDSNASAAACVGISDEIALSIKTSTARYRNRETEGRRKAGQTNGQTCMYRERQTYRHTDTQTL